MDFLYFNLWNRVKEKFRDFDSKTYSQSSTSSPFLQDVTKDETRRAQGDSSIWYWFVDPTKEKALPCFPENKT